MEVPFGFDQEGNHSYVIKLNTSIYGLKQASSNWYHQPTHGLKDREFFPSQIDPCAYYKDNCIVLVYVDDCIIFSKDKSVSEELIYSLQHGPEKYVLTDEGNINKYLGVDIDRSKKGSIETIQPYLIERCLEAIGVNDTMNIKKTPSTKTLMHKDKDGDPRKHQWNYRQVIGMLN